MVYDHLVCDQQVDRARNTARCLDDPPADSWSEDAFLWIYKTKSKDKCMCEVFGEKITYIHYLLTVTESRLSVVCRVV